MGSLTGALLLGVASASFGQTMSAVRLPATAFPDGESAFELLAQSLRRECSYNVCALIDQRDPFGHGWQRVKEDRDRSGHVYKCVLQPLRMQGIESIDDGERWVTVMPDQGVVLDQTSPSKDECDDGQRLRLAKRNYRFEMDGRSSIAGRQVVTVVARPVHAQLPTRRYWLDTQTLYPLKVEEVRDGESTVQFMTVDVSYPSTMNPDEFKFRDKVGMKTYRFSRPENVKSTSDAQRILGFKPVLPKGKPLGFEPQELQISQDGAWQALVVRLSDGLIRATVYEYVADNRPVSALDQSSVREVNGVSLLVVCSLGEDVRETLLDSFARARMTRRSGADRPAPRLNGTTDAGLGVRIDRTPFKISREPTRAIVNEPVGD